MTLNDLAHYTRYFREIRPFSLVRFSLECVTRLMREVNFLEDCTVDMCHYTLGNFSPKVWSWHCAVRLLAIANAKLVKKYGHRGILEPIIIDDIKKIEYGFPCLVNGTQKIVHGKVVSCTGDTEGQHEWGGYKVGVGFAFQKCCHCQCHYEAMQQSFYEDFVPRTKL